jgi:hypothetical protein
VEQTQFGGKGLCESPCGVVVKLHKEVFLTVDIFFVNNIPFFLTRSRKICFTAVNHLVETGLSCRYSKRSRRYTSITSIVASASQRCMQTGNSNPLRL